MDTAQVRGGVEFLECALGLKRRVVGTRFLFEQDEIEASDIALSKVKRPYCVMVKRASRGHDVLALEENFGCRASAGALGIIPPDTVYSSGRHYRRLGLYRDLAVARNVGRNMSLCEHAALGVEVRPLEVFTEEPDVILMIVNPHQAMRLVQAVTYQFGYQIAFKAAGNRAVCSECTAYPLESNRMNISMMCAGTRFMAGWRDEEMGVGMPFNMFMAVVQGIRATLNPVEPDGKKREIEARFKAHGRTDWEMEYGRNYYTGLYLNQKGGPR